MANRLAQETSPYLLQHQNNPVDWYPWGDEAFDRAKAEDKPVFLSVGYSSCHWCHVMEHESFEDSEVAGILNEHYVSVKVDREERPDVDEAYMTAVQLSSGRGGWPMSVFMTPEKKPFFAGTYFPKENRGQHPGFLTICRHIASLWRDKRQELEENAAEFALGLAEALGRSAPSSLARFDDSFLADAVRSLAADFDNRNGGFGSAPKFPPHTSIDFLLRYVGRESAPDDVRQLAIGMALSTLEQMALGGIHDHVGGGFHRYSTDERWLLPHFEKMLYDNALMLSNYAVAAAMVREVDPVLEGLYLQTASGIVRWLLDEMRSGDGLFYSALDADSEGEEGKFYVWTDSEVREVLGDRAEAFLKAYGFQKEGNFEDEATRRKTGANIPHLQEPTGAEFADDLARLREARESRVRPGLDDKALVSWNGLTIGALVMAGMTAPAREAAARVLEAERHFGRLPHQIVRGVPSGMGYLDDYAAFGWSLFLLGRVEEQGNWTAEAERLTGEMIDRFWDGENGGFFSTSAEHEVLFGRTKPAFDSPTPSANALALRCLVAMNEAERAGKTLNAFMGWMERAPQATEALYSASLNLAEESVTANSEPLVDEVVAEFSAREIVADAAGVGRATVLLRVPAGLHINSNTPPARWLTPTGITVQPIRAEVTYPPASDDVYEGDTHLEVALFLPHGSRGEEFELRVTYQACTDTECLLPKEQVFQGVLLPFQSSG